MVTESIRLSFNDLGHLYYEIGNLHEAQRHFIKMREYCTTIRQTADLTFNIISILLNLEQYSIISSYLSRSDSWSHDPVSSSKTLAVQGILELNKANYSDAALHFLSINRALEGFTDVIAAEDVIIYGVLCGLASLKRADFKNLVDTKTYKLILEKSPRMKALVNNFLSRSYGLCLSFLTSMASEWKLDIYLHAHIDKLIKIITETMLIDYFTPYTTVSVVKIAEEINFDVEHMEEILFKLIIEGKLNAKIDAITKTLYRKSSDIHTSTLQSVKKLGDKHIRSLREGLLRMSMIQEKVLVAHVDGRAEGIGRIDANTLRFVPRQFKDADPHITVDDMNVDDDFEDQD